MALLRDQPGRASPPARSMACTAASGSCNAQATRAPAGAEVTSMHVTITSSDIRRRPLVLAICRSTSSKSALTTGLPVSWTSPARNASVATVSLHPCACINLWVSSATATAWCQGCLKSSAMRGSGDSKTGRAAISRRAVRSPVAPRRRMACSALCAARRAGPVLLATCTRRAARRGSSARIAAMPPNENSGTAAKSRQRRIRAES